MTARRTLAGLAGTLEMRRDATTLWLPIERRGAAWAAAGVLGAVYLFTMAGDLSIYDSAELALVARTLGLGHPVGQPLHTLLGWIASHLPGVAPLTGLAALSALPAALSALPVTSIAERISGRAGAATATAVIVCGLHAALWEPATRVEVYALATFFALHAVANLVREPRSWLGPGAALGLAASANPYIAVIAALAVAPTLAVALVRRRVGPRALLGGVAGGLLGLLPYLYVPIIAARGPEAFVWGDPTTGPLLRRYLTGADFPLARGAGGGTILEHVALWTRWSLDHGLLPLVAAGLIAHALRRAATLTATAIAVALTLLLIASNGVFFLENPDYLGYLGVPLWLAAAGIAGAVAWAARGGGRSRLYAAVGLAAILLDVALAPPGPLARTRHRDHVARTIAQAALDEAPPNAILVVESDHWAWPLIYLQEAEGRRPDVVIFPYWLSSGSWIWKHIYELHPEMPGMILAAGPDLPRFAHFLELNRDHPRLFELVELAHAVGETPCIRGWLIATGRQCDAGAPDPAIASTIAGELGDLGHGSPPTDELLAQLAWVRGKSLWELGHPALALDAFLAGVPASHRPRAPAPPGLAAVPPLRSPLPVGPHAIGHPSQNLIAAALLFRAAGDAAAEEECLRLAGEL